MRWEPVVHQSLHHHWVALIEDPRMDGTLNHAQKEHLEDKTAKQNAINQLAQESIHTRFL
jgi:hypothetical protein